MNICLLYCEGIHDVSFFVRLLKDNGFTDYSDSLINKIPDKDVGSIILSSLKGFTYDENQNLKQKPFAPSILSREGNYILIYPTGGHIYKYKSEPLKDIFIKTTKNFISLKASELFKDKIETIKIGLFYDADNDATVKLKDINNYLKSSGLFDLTEDLRHLSINNLNNIDSIGCYLFMSAGNNSGCLEDVLIEILEVDHKKPLNDSMVFLDANLPSGKPSDFNKEKAIIGIIGQLEKSGMGNGPIISQTTLFRKKLTTPKCLEISRFIEEML